MSHRCPRCGKHPVELATICQREPRLIAACSCYPHPPRCITCHSELDAKSRCVNENCMTPWAIQPDPITDPLFAEEYRL